jgi:hypothetical protein
MFRMNCNDFEKTVLALAAYRLMDAERRAALLRHAETCGRCDARLREESAFLSAVCEVRGAIAHEQAPSRVEGSSAGSVARNLKLGRRPQWIKPRHGLTGKWRQLLRRS